MLCPKCDQDTKVVDSRERPNKTVRRRHECLNCKNRFTTCELRSDHLQNIVNNIYQMEMLLGQTRQFVEAYDLERRPSDVEEGDATVNC